MELLCPKTFHWAQMVFRMSFQNSLFHASPFQNLQIAVFPLCPENKLMDEELIDLVFFVCTKSITCWIETLPQLVIFGSPCLAFKIVYYLDPFLTDCAVSCCEGASHCSWDLLVALCA